MEIPFIKIQNAGNDYVYVEKKSISRLKINVPSLARRISDRNRGVGSDGLIIIDAADRKPAFMRIYNSDGSEAEFCGNGLRGVALFLRRVLRSRARKFTVSTRWNDYRAEVVNLSGDTADIKVSLDGPLFDAGAIGYSKKKGICMDVTISIGQRRRDLYCVAMPNPVAVIFVDNFDFGWQKEGRAVENSPMFKNGINVMFTRIDSPKRLTVRPWERGSGATLACGSGAAAAVAVSGLLGYTNGNVSVIMPGGTLKTSWNIEENKIYQQGTSRIVFTGLFRV
jgi:diaminopimelate epimerase